MNREKALSFGQVWKRLTAAIVTVTLIAAFMPISKVAAADDGSTGYQVVITETTDSSGFVHPGVGLTKSILENVREQIQNQKEPWYSYYVAMTKSATASKTVTSSNQSAADPNKPDSVAFNSQSFNSRFIADGLKAYTQSLMYVITGEEVYRSNAMHIIRIWSQMDPKQYVYFTDSHIHTGIPLNRMVMAAEIMRYTSSENPSLAWTETDTTTFTNNLINPVIETFQHSNNYFMNQHNYPLLGAMAGYIFTNNKERYDEAVEWWSVNKTAIDQGFNGSIQQLFRSIDTNDLTGEKLDKPVIQHVEMGRDQAHGGGDLTNAAITTRLLHAQGTMINPENGTVSQASNAVDPMEFLDNRIIKAADYFWQYMLGYDPNWVPVAYSIAPDGTIKDTYNRISSQYKGRFLTANFWDFYSYYTYNKHENVADIAPYYAEAFTKKQSLNWENVDGGDDYWLYLPKAAEADADKFLPPQQPNLGNRNEVEIRYTALDNHTEKLTEGDTGFIRFNATEDGAKIALLSGGTGSKNIAFKIRSNGYSEMDMSTGVKDTLTLPDTHGEWQYVSYTLNQFQSMGDFFDLKIRGQAGTTVDMDQISFDTTALKPPVFQSGTTATNVFSYVGVPIRLELSASGESIVYDSSSLPQGATLDDQAGTFSWTPTEGGQHSFVVSASNGDTATAKNVVINVSADRASAIADTVSPYDKSKIYLKASLDQYKAVYEDTINKSATMTDAQFIEQLLTLRKAVESLQLVSPGALDGSLDYSKMVSSAMGTSVAVLLDGDNDTFTGFTTGLIQVLDFGADYKVSADAFAVQSRMNFTDRGAGIAIFGSNDNENWTRLTPGETPFNSGLNRLVVDDKYKNEQYRFIKIQMVTKYPDIIHNSVQGMMELGEFRIYGERHEVDNKLTSVSFGTNQGLKGRIVFGDNAQLKIQAKEPIQNVQVKIQGQTATVTTQDNVNWTATAILNKGVATGPIKFTVDYQNSDGTKGATTFVTTDNTKLFLADESDVIQNVTSIAALIDSTTNRTAAQTLTQTSYLFDNTEAFSDYRNGSAGAGNGAYITFDFKKGNQVAISSVELLARQDSFYTRIGGTVIQGSNDNTTWTTLTNAAGSTADWQTLQSNNSNSLYRYIRIYNSNAWFGNMSEVKFHGKVVSPLNDSLNQAAAIDRNLYTPDSLQVLDTAVAAAKSVLSNSASTQADIDAAARSLTSALNALVYIPGMPVFETIKDQTVVPGNKLTFQVNATNAGNSVAFEASGLPSGAQFDKDSHTFTWTPDVNQGGVYSVVFKATAGGLSSTKTVKLKVIGSPIVNTDGTTQQVEGKVGQTITYQVPVVADPSGEPIIFDAKLPAGATLNTLNGVLKWTPNNVDYGNHSITVKVSNGYFEVEVPLQIKVDLNVLPPANYTKGSYYLYSNEIARIKSELEQPGADKSALASEILVAEQSLVRVPLPVYFVEEGSTKLITTNAGTTGLTEGKFETGRSVSMNGNTNDYVQLPADHPFKNEDQITIAAWVKWNGGGDWQRIFDFGNNTNQYLFLTPQSGNKTLRFAIKNGGTEQYIQSSTPLAANEWVHVAVTLGAGTAKLYVNGAQVATGNISIKASDINPTLSYIGKSQFAADPMFNGLVDQFTIYDTVLSAENIKTAMNNSVPSIDKSLLAIFLASANELSEEAFNPVTWASFVDKRSAAESVYENANAAQVDIDKAAAELQMALKELSTLKSLSVTPQSISIKTGESQSLTVTANYSDDTNSDVTETAEYSTNNDEVASVDEAGVVTALSAGTATITVTFKGKSSVVEVTVAELTKPKATDKPGKPVLFSDNGFDTGLRDGSYTITMDQWWGNNGTEYKLYENGVIIDTQSLTDDSPNAQKTATVIKDKSNGTYVYTCKLTNSFGTTSCDSLTVVVADASPGNAVLSSDNWDGDGNYNVTMNLWWGTNATTFELYENGELVKSIPLDAATPGAQTAKVTITGKEAGTYEYYGKLINKVGESITAKIIVKVS